MAQSRSGARNAVVVVNFNGGEHVERCLESLSRQTLPPDRTIVVDNASTDGSADAIAERFPEVELVRLDGNAGFAAANNLAARAANDCEWIALLNPDAFPDPAWLEELMRAAREHPEYSFFGSLLVRAETPDVVDGTGDVYHVGGMAWRRDEGEPVAAVHRPSGEVFSPCAAAALYRRDAFLSVGGFDETYFCYHEDTDLAFRLRLAGHRCFFVSESVARHVGFAIAGETSEFTMYHSHRNSVWTFAKNMPAPLLWLYLPQHLLVNAIDVATAAYRGRGRAALAAKRDALRGLPGVLRRRRAAERRVGALELRRAMATGADPYVLAFRRASRSVRERVRARRR